MASGQGNLSGNLGGPTSGSKGGPGWLLGWKPLASSIDKLEATISKDIGALTKALLAGMAKGSLRPNATIPAQLFSGRLASLNQVMSNLGVMAGQNISAMYGGKGNAGQAGQGTGGAATPTPAKGNGGHGQPPAGGGGSGGGGGAGGGAGGQYGGKGNGGITPTQLGALITGGSKVGAGLRVASLAAYGFNTIAKYGANGMADRMSNELAGQWGAMGMSGPTPASAQTFLRQALGTAGAPRSGMAFNNTDALAAELTRARISGASDLTDPRDRAADRGWRGINLFNPTLGSTGSAEAMGDLLSKSGRRSMWAGLGQLYGTDNSYIGDVDFTKRWLKALYPHQDITKIDPKKLRSSFGVGQSSFTMLQTLGVQEKTAGAIQNTVEGIQGLQSRGMLYPEIEKTLNAATDGSDPAAQKAAQAKLSDHGFDVTAFAKSLETSSFERGLGAETNQGYIDGVKKATDGLNEFTRGLKTFLSTEPMKTVIEQSGALAIVKAHPEALIGGLGGLNDPKSNPFGIGDPSRSGGAGLGGGNPFGFDFRKPSDMNTRHGGGQAATSVPTKKQESPRKVGLDAKGAAGAVLAAARSQIGVPYSWGGGGLKGPSYGSEQGANIFGFDCSSLLQYAYGKGAGIDISRTTWTQMKSKKGRDIGLNDVAPGDLVYTSGGKHVVMWAGDGYVHAPQTGRNVEEVKGQPYRPFKARRFLNSSGNYHGNGLGPQAQTKDGIKTGLPTNAGSGQEGGLGSSGIQGLGNLSGSVEELELLKEIFGAAIAGGSGQGRLSSAMGLGGEYDPSDPIKVNDAKTSKSKKPKKAGGDLPKLPPGKGAKRNIALGKRMAGAKGWDGGEWDALYRLWMKESGWNELAMNKSSGAYGIPQSLPGKKMASAGRDWKTNAATQIKWGLGYIEGRYKDPLNAWGHSKKVGWYDKGAWNLPHDELAVVHKGEMIVPARPAETIREVLLKDSGSGKPTGTASFTFGPNSVVIHLGSGVSEGSGRAVANELMAELERLTTYKHIAQGV